MADTYVEESVKIFVVEDDPTYGKFIEYVINLNPDHDVKVFDTGKKMP